MCFKGLIGLKPSAECQLWDSRSDAMQQHDSGGHANCRKDTTLSLQLTAGRPCHLLLLDVLCRSAFCQGNKSVPFPSCQQVILATAVLITSAVSSSLN